MVYPLDLSRVDGVVADMDGVLWRGPRVLPGVTELLNWLGAQGIPFVFATNNSSKHPLIYVRRLAEMGVTIEGQQVVTSALAAARWLAREYGRGVAVHVLGEHGLRSAIEDAGMRLAADGDQAAVVVVGIDFDLTYAKLAAAAQLIAGGAAFVGTNGDRTFPSDDRLMPGAGAILAALEACTGVSPTKIGKPERAIFEMALELLGTRPEGTIMVGDRLDTDVLGARRAGLRTVLVTTGVDDAASAARAEAPPDLVVAGLPELLAMWQASKQASRP